MQVGAQRHSGRASMPMPCEPARQLLLSRAPVTLTNTSMTSLGSNLGACARKGGGGGPGARCCSLELARRQPCGAASCPMRGACCGTSGACAPSAARLEQCGSYARHTRPLLIEPPNNKGGDALTQVHAATSPSSECPCECCAWPPPSIPWWPQTPRHAACTQLAVPTACVTRKHAPSLPSATPGCGGALVALQLSQPLTLYNHAQPSCAAWRCVPGAPTARPGRGRRPAAPPHHGDKRSLHPNTPFSRLKEAERASPGPFAAACGRNGSQMAGGRREANGPGRRRRSCQYTRTSNMRSLVSNAQRARSACAPARTPRVQRRLAVFNTAAVAQKSVSGTMADLKKQGKWVPTPALRQSAAPLPCANA